MFTEDPSRRRAPLSAAEIGLLHKADHVLNVLLENELEAELEGTRPRLPATGPNRVVTGRLRLPQTGQRRAQ